MHYKSFKECREQSPTGPALQTHELIDKFMKTLENERSASPHTLTAYRRDLSLSFAGMPTFLEDDLIPHLIKAQRKWSHLSATSRNRRIAALKSFLHYLFLEELISQDLRHRLQSSKTARRLPRYISVDEVISVLQFFSDKGQRQSTNVSTWKQELLFHLLYGGGLRISEACSLTWTQIDFTTRTVRVNGKGGKDRMIALPARSLERISQRAERESAFVWGDKALNPRTGYEMIRDLGKKAGLLRPLHPHALRHSYATHLLASGANLRTLQELLGHASLAATEKYTHLTVDQLARTLEAHHPLSHKPRKSS